MDVIRQERVKKLFEFSKKIKLENKLQITALSPIKKLVENKATTLNYYLYMLEKSFNYFQSSQSLSTVYLINDTEKHEFYLSTIETLQSFIQNNGSGAQEKNYKKFMITFSNNFQAGSEYLLMLREEG